MKMDELSEFEKFRETILPAIRKDISAGLSPDEIMTKYASIAAGRLVSRIAAHPDNAAGDRAAESILDRVIGKPTQKAEVTHRYADMSEEEIDAMIKAKEVEAGIVDGSGEKS